MAPTGLCQHCPNNLPISQCRLLQRAAVPPRIGDERYLARDRRHGSSGSSRLAVFMKQRIKRRRHRAARHAAAFMARAFETRRQKTSLNRESYRLEKNRSITSERPEMQASGQHLWPWVFPCSTGRGGGTRPPGCRASRRMGRVSQGTLRVMPFPGVELGGQSYSYSVATSGAFSSSRVGSRLRRGPDPGCFLWFTHFARSGGISQAQYTVLVRF